MKVAVVGVGAIGSRHTAYLRGAGHRVVTVDPERPADFSHVDGLTTVSDVDAWIVSTPTDAHLSVVDEILVRAPAARVLLEKPACEPRDLPRLERYALNHRDARIVVNDVYDHSVAVRQFARLVRDVGASDPVSKITVEFTKNRDLDADRGRFVDSSYGEVGYEWFHMLAIVRSLVPRDQYRRYLARRPQVVTDEMRTRTRTGDIPEIELYASTKGEVAFPETASFAFTEASTREQINSGAIPYGSDLRYRFVNVETHSGTALTLVFEPHFGAGHDYKNEHAIHVRGAEVPHSLTISGNQLHHALSIQLRELVGGGRGTSRLRLAEHRHMSMLTDAVFADRLCGPRPPTNLLDLRGVSHV
ncbi:Gfo/Idh/MocA family oxidoreductase [Nocardiopsis sp. NPDC007018]|uniref:Gfo/Idh/MocA family oxidoreductase n=1 Tax=Nocardiopsis sp. NPDC007018 TaxID=3155721 RepID=UPI0033D1C80E